VLSSGLFGLLGSRLFPGIFPPPKVVEAGRERATVIGQMAAAGALEHAKPSRQRALRVMLVCSFLWGAPIAIIVFVVGPNSVFAQEAFFFSKAAVVTFGGAYAVLAYIAQRAVETYGWLQPGEMLDGLGLAETTPGPLIMVVQFVGFLGAFRDPGALPPLVAGVLGSMITVWVTFVPCFLWIFLGAPYIEALRGHRPLRAALSTITAAVVGVILNLSIWFGLHVVFRQVQELNLGRLRLLVPSLASIDFAAVALAALAMLALFRLRLGVPKTLALAAGLGALLELFR
jgi:chromate transporter